MAPLPWLPAPGGTAIDIGVRGDASFVADLLGVASRYAQLGWLAAFNVAVWVGEPHAD